MPGRRREAQRAETRRLVLEAAYDLFERRGYDRTTMRAVADAAGVAPGTIFNHFPDKTALLAAAFEDDLGRVIDEAFATEPPGPLRPRLLHLAERFYSFYARRPALSRVMVGGAILAEGGGEERLQEQAMRFLARVAELAEAASEAGELRDDVTAMEVATAFWSDYFSILVAGLRQPGLAVEAQLALLSRLLDLRWEGLGGRGRPG